MIINSKTIVIGNGDGKYYGGNSKLVDTLFGIGKISHLVINDQSYARDFIQNRETSELDISILYPPPLTDGMILVVNFENPVILSL